MSVQLLTLTLDGINAGDYMDRVRDPEPRALDLDLRSITVRGDPLGNTIEAVLSWKGSPPVPSAAAPLAGLPLTADVIGVKSHGPMPEVVAVGGCALSAAA